MSNVFDLFTVGESLQRAGALDLAEEAYRAAIATEAAYPAPHFQLGLVLAAQGRLEEAAGCFRTAAQLAPYDAQAHNNLGVALQLLGRFDEAAAAYRRALEARPEYAEAHNNLGVVLEVLGQLDEAVANCRRAIELKPDYGEAYSSLGVALDRQGKSPEAAAALGRAIELRPNYAEAYANLGAVLDHLDRLDEAQSALERALALKPNLPEARVNLGMLLERRGRFDEALALFASALAPHCPQAHLNYGLALLRLGRLAEGWPEYQWRLITDRLGQKNLPGARWQGEPLAGRTILLCEEQGLGDTLQFVRYAELLKRHGATVVLQCRPQLVPLLARARGIDAAVETLAATPRYDCHVSLPSLPGILRTTLDTIPADVPYLSVDPAATARWKEEFAPLAGFKVGVAWHGDPVNANNRHRSFPVVALAPLAATPGVHLVSLQFGPGREQLAELGGRFPILDLGDRLGDFHTTGAIMQNLDLVITCDSAPAHLAGALGLPVWVSLPFVPDWRWLLNRADSPWYPTMRLDRQPRLGDWQSVFAAIARDLSALSQQRSLR